MKLEGVHHITAITAEAQRNVDFYAGVLGLRLVKKTVNQDDPTVYHLFYADEKGDAGSDLTFFEYPGAPPGRAGDGMVHTIGWRVASPEALDFWAERLATPASPVRARRRHPALRGPRGPRPRAAGLVGPRPAADRRAPRGPAELALQGFDGARAYAWRPRARAGRCSRTLGFEPRGRRLGGPRREPRRPLGLRRAAGRARGLQGRAPSTTSPGRRRSTSTRPGARRRSRGRAPDAGDRPLLLPLDLLPRAERRPLRDRHARARLHRRRAARAPRREALAAARLRAPAGEGRADRDADRQPAPAARAPVAGSRARPP